MQLRKTQRGAEKIAEEANANYVRPAAEFRAANERADRVEATAGQGVNAAARGSELRPEQSMRNWEERRGRHYRELARARAMPPTSRAHLSATRTAATPPISRNKSRDPGRDACYALRTVVPCVSPSRHRGLSPACEATLHGSL